MRKHIADIRRHPNVWVRRTIGVTLILGGIVGFLSVLGSWMILLGLLVLSDDVPWIRRLRRRLAVSWGRWWRERRIGSDRHLV